MRSSFLAVTFALFVVHVVCVRDAHASAVTYADGGFARISSERAVLVWDATHGTEDLALDVTFDADARDFGLLVPTPANASVAKEEAARIDAMASIADAGASAGSDAERLYAFEVSTLRDAAALSSWLVARGHVARPNVATWAASYFAQGVALTAIAYVATKPGRHFWRVPAVHIAFATRAPSFPYAEPAADAKDESDFLRRVSAADDAPRTLDVWAIASEKLHAVGGRAGGLAMRGGGAVDVATLPRVLGDEAASVATSGAPHAWFVTHFGESVSDRVAPSDFTFASGWPLAATSSEPNAPAHVVPAHRSNRAGAGARSRRALAVLLAIGLAFAAIAALLERRAA